MKSFLDALGNGVIASGGVYKFQVAFLSVVIIMLS